jgi:hypothetical protein
MAIVNDGKSVVTCDAVILWDGITRPETDTYDGVPAYNIKVALPQNAAEVTELETLCNTTLQHSEFKGAMPQGGNWPIASLDLAKFPADAARLTGMVGVNAKSKYVPQVYDANGQVLQPMQYGQMLYPGAVVRVLVGCYAFNNKSKGLAFSLDGIMIVDAVNAPKLSVGGGMTESEKRNAFFGGASAPTTAPSAAPTMTPPSAAPSVQPAHDILTPPPSAPAAPAVVMRTASDGKQYSEDTMRGWGWTEQQIQMCPVAG